MKLLQKALFFLPVLLATLASVPTASAQNHLVISQVYGGGGNTGAPYKYDFVELFNPTTATIGVGGYSIQYQSSTASTFTVAITLTSGKTIAPGQYYLVQLASQANVGANLPTADDSSSAVNISATAGHVALVINNTALTSCSGYVDEVGYGSTSVPCAETANAPAPSNTTSIFRSSLCTTTNNNSADFTTEAPNPHNSSMSAGACASSAPAASIVATGYPTPTNRGAAHNLTVTARDSSGNAASSYRGTVTLTSTDPAAVLPAPYTFTAGDAGIHVFSVTLNTTGTQSITATDTTNNFASSQTGIVVNATLWIVNANTTVSHVTQGGLVLSTAGTAGTPATLGGIAVDNAGFAYAVTNAASNLTQYSPTTGALLYTSTVGGINQPNAVTVDGLGSVWIANANNTITQLNVSPSTAPIPVSPATGYTGGALATPSAIVVDSTGSVWVANSTGGTFTRFFGAAAPVTIPLVTSVTNGTLGTRP